MVFLQHTPCSQAVKNTLRSKEDTDNTLTDKTEQVTFGMKQSLGFHIWSFYKEILTIQWGKKYLIPCCSTTNQQRIVTPGENGMPGHSIPNPSGAEAIVSDLLVRVLVAHPSTAAAILRLDIKPLYPKTETYILKDKTVNLAYRMYFEYPVVLKKILVPYHLVNEGTPYISS